MKYFQNKSTSVKLDNPINQNKTINRKLFEIKDGEDYVNEFEENEKDHLLQMDMMKMTTSDQCPQKLDKDQSNTDLIFVILF